MTQCRAPITPEGQARLDAWLEKNKKRRKGKGNKEEKGKGHSRQERHHTSLAISAVPAPCHEAIYSPHTFLPDTSLHSHTPPTPLPPSLLPSPLFCFDGMDCLEDPEEDIYTGDPEIPTPDTSGGRLLVAEEAHSKLSDFPTYTGGPPEDPLQVGSGSGMAGDSLGVSTGNLGGNFEFLIRSPHPSIFYFWGPTSSICCQIFTACGGPIELMFPPHLCMCAAACMCRSGGNMSSMFLPHAVKV